MYSALNRDLMLFFLFRDLHIIYVVNWCYIIYCILVMLGGFVQVTYSILMFANNEMITVLHFMAKDDLSFLRKLSYTC